VDIVEALTDSVNSRDYWFKMKKREKLLGVELSTICRQLKMQAGDMKFYLTDCADIEGLLRIIQSIPSPKAEPFKIWLAKVGHERIQEMSDPSQALDRARENWKKLGRSEKWIQQRMTGQETRNKLTYNWKQTSVEKNDEVSFLTNSIHQEWLGFSVKKHEQLKKLKTQNLRVHISAGELIFTALAELSTCQIAETDSAKKVLENANAGKKGGKIAKDAFFALEEKTGIKGVSPENILHPGKNFKQISLNDT